MNILRLDRERTFAVILLLGLLAMTARNAVDPDLWWHLRTGEWIVETGTIPHSDPFSFTRQGSPWVSHEWLSEVAFYELWRYGGAGGLIIFSALVTTAGFLLLYRRCPEKPAGAAIAVAIGALAAAPAWGVRPQMFTFALTSLMLWLVERAEQRPALLLCVPPLFLLWLNLHAGFALGPALLLAWMIGLAWEAASGATEWRQARPYLLRIGLALAACMALVPLNPSGAQLYRYPVDVIRSEGMRSFIAEWHPPDFHQLRYAPIVLMWLALLVAMTKAKTRPKARVMVPLALTFAAALDAVRHIPILVLVAVPVIAGIFPLASPATKRAGKAPGYRMAFRGAVVILLAIFTVTRWDNLLRRQSRMEAESFPVCAVEYLKSHRVPDRLFIYYDWGGYAVWRLYPDYRVFIDGRADLYGDSLLRQFQDILQVRSEWRQDLDLWKVETVLVPPSAPLAEALSLDPDWRVDYRDSQAVLFVRRPGKEVMSQGLSAEQQVTKKHEKMCTGTRRICETRPDRA